MRFFPALLFLQLNLLKIIKPALVSCLKEDLEGIESESVSETNAIKHFWGKITNLANAIIHDGVEHTLGDFSPYSQT